MKLAPMSARLPQSAAKFDHHVRGNDVDVPSKILAAVYLIIAFVIAPAIIVASNFGGYHALAAVVLVLTVILVWYEWRRIGHPLTPAGIVGVTGLLVFGLRPLTIAINGSTTAGARLDSRSFVGPTAEAGTVALAQVILFYGVLGLVYFILRMRPGEIAAPRNFVTTTASVRRAAIALGGSVAFAAVCALVLIQAAGGFGAYLSGLSFRSSFLSGQYYLTLAYIPLSIALVIYVLVRRACPGERPWSVLATIGALALLASCFLTGARGPLLLSGIVPLLLLKQAGRNKLTGRTLVLLGLAIAVGAMVMSLVFRENSYDGGASLRQLGEAPIETLLDRLTSGAETRPFDSLILLNEVQRAGEMSWQFGWTYLAVPLWFIPGALLDSKGGANAWFTSTYIPRFYYPERIETSISAIGESFANFGYVGIVLVAALIALACAKIGLRTEGQTSRSTALSILLTPVAFSLIRSDAYQAFSVIILIVGLTFLFHRVSIGHPVALQRAREHESP